MSISRTQRRLRQKEANKRLVQKETPFKEFDINSVRAKYEGLTRAFANNRYIVQIDDNAETSKGKCIRAMIQTLDDKPIVNHWSELQRIKNEIFGKEKVGIEFYPKVSELIDDHNIYWLWIVEPDLLPMPLYSLTIDI